MAHRYGCHVMGSPATSERRTSKQIVRQGHKKRSPAGRGVKDESQTEDRSDSGRVAVILLDPRRSSFERLQHQLSLWFDGVRRHQVQQFYTLTTSLDHG